MLIGSRTINPSIPPVTEYMISAFFILSVQGGMDGKMEADAGAMGLWEIGCGFMGNRV